MRHEKMIIRDNGLTIRLVHQFMPNPIGVSDWDVFALVSSPSQPDPRVVTYERSPNKSLNGLSVEEYKQHGRKGLLAILSPAELIKAKQEAIAALESGELSV